MVPEVSELATLVPGCAKLENIIQGPWVTNTWQNWPLVEV